MSPAAPRLLERPAAVLLALAVLLPPLLVALPSTSSLGSMEMLSLASSQETWLRQRGGEPAAWLLPSLHGQPRIQKPPLLVWLDLAAWSGLDERTATPELLVARARAVSVLFALVTLLATFEIGRRLGGRWLGTAALLVTGSLSLFLQQARETAYDVQLAAWVAVAVACGLRALDPRGAAPAGRRRWWAWIAAGLCIGAALLTKGPVTFALVLPPLFAALWLSPAPRAAGAAGLALACGVGAAVAAPWFAWVTSHVPNAQPGLLREYAARHYKATQFWYHLQLVPRAFPWSLWLGAALVGPWLRNASRLRGPVWIAWTWLVTVGIAFSFPALKQPRHLVPVLPAAGILAAWLWGVADRERALGGRWPAWLAGLHFGVLIAAGLGLLGFLAFQDELLRWRGREAAVFVDAGPLAAAALLALGAAGAGAVAWRRGARDLALLLTAVWASLLFGAGTPIYAHSPRHAPPHRVDAERVGAAIGDVPAYFLDAGSAAPSDELAFFARRIIRIQSPAQIEQRLRRGESFWLVAAADAAADAAVLRWRLRAVLDFEDGRDGARRLYRTP
jgi:4-amino-4-deoxy-L-arabinose transferase-like glycosyltransferase